MPFIPVPNVAQLRFEGTIDGQQTINDLFFRNGGGIFVLDLADLVTTLNDWFNFSFATGLSEDWSTVAVHGRDLTTEAGAVYDFSATPNTGGVTGEAAPNNVAACISFRTGTAGRSYRGRNYIPAVPNSAITLNTMSAPFMADMIAAYSQLLVGGAALPVGWEWVVVSRYSGTDVNGDPVPRATGTATLVPNVLFTNNTVDSRRRRLPGRGK